MKAYFVIIAIIFLYSCQPTNMKIPPNPLFGTPIGPFWWTGDTLSMQLSDYFPDLSLLKKISASKNVELVHPTDSILLLVPTEQTVPLGNLTFRYEGFDYDIPLLTKPQDEKNLPVIFTADVLNDTIFLESDRPVEKWSVYIQNYKLKDKFLFPTVRHLKIALPMEMEEIKSSILRVWAVNESGISNEICIPLTKNKVVKELHLLDSIPGLERMKKNFTHDDSLTGKEVSKIFFRKYDRFPQLHYFVTENLQEQGINHSPRRMLLTKDYKIPIHFTTDSTTANRFAQLWTFHISLPGVPEICSPDSLHIPIKAEEDLTAIRRQMALLNHLYENSFSLQHGDFIPLRVENEVYAYMRSYFEKETIVVFNKNQEAVTLKLDLPDLKREENFRALFDNRFSYNNSKLILDVPGNGVEVIYNEHIPN